MNPLLAATDLTLTAGGRPIVDRVSFHLDAGETVAVTGPSGCGKTTLAMAVLGHLRDGVAHTGGRLLVDGAPTLPEPPPGLRGATIGYVGQDPGSSLSPYATVASFLLRSTGRRIPRSQRREAVSALLARVGLADLGSRYPHQLSGGQQQRVVLAGALARDPRLLLLDEPTTALDLVAKAEVVKELRHLSASGVALLWITHDLPSIRGIATRVVSLGDSSAAPAGALVSPVVVRASPAVAGKVLPPAGPTVLSATKVTAGYPRSTPVLSQVDLELRQGECLAVLGASGVGKTTLARTLAGFHQPAAGTLLLNGEQLSWDIHRRTKTQRAAIQLVGQNPADALHPRQTIRTALVRPLVKLRNLSSGKLDGEVASLLDAVQLPAELANRLPGELSGGQRQRVALARALAARPTVLVCDEIASALDTGTQDAVLRVLTELRGEFGLAVVLITHDPEVAAGASDRLLVLTNGRVARTGATAELLPPAESPQDRVRQLLIG